MALDSSLELLSVGGRLVVITFHSLEDRIVKNLFKEKTEVHVAGMTDGEIDDYIATGEPLDKAGAYGAQGGFAKFIEGFNGDYCNVVGLPIAALYKNLKKIAG